MYVSSHIHVKELSTCNKMIQEISVRYTVTKTKGELPLSFDRLITDVKSALYVRAELFTYTTLMTVHNTTNILLNLPRKREFDIA